MSNSSIWPFLPAKNSTSLSHASGAYLYMDNGDKILDAAGGAIVANIGHGRKEVADAIHAATMNCTYAVPPWLTRLATERSTVSTSNTRSSMAGSISAMASSGSSARPTPRSSARCTMRPTT